MAHAKFTRSAQSNAKGKVFAVLNFSAQPLTVTLKDTLLQGHSTGDLSGKAIDLDAATRLDLKAWRYQVFVR